MLKQTKRNKWTTAYELAFYTVYRIDGSSIAARRVTDGREIYRDSSHFKLANMIVNSIDENRQDQEDWRETLLQNTPPREDDPHVPNQGNEFPLKCPSVRFKCASQQVSTTFIKGLSC